MIGSHVREHNILPSGTFEPWQGYRPCSLPNSLRSWACISQFNLRLGLIWHCIEAGGFLEISLCFEYRTETLQGLIELETYRVRSKLSPKFAHCEEGACFWDRLSACLSTIYRNLDLGTSRRSRMACQIEVGRSVVRLVFWWLKVHLQFPLRSGPRTRFGSRRARRADIPKPPTMSMSALHPIKSAHRLKAISCCGDRNGLEPPGKWLCKVHV